MKTFWRAMSRGFVGIAAVAYGGGVCAGELLPAEQFARGPAIQQAVISRDGRTVAHLVTVEKEQRLVFRDLATGKVQGAPGTGVLHQQQ